MRENRTYGSEGRESGNSTGLPYPYHVAVGVSPQVTGETIPEAALAATATLGENTHFDICYRR